MIRPALAALAALALAPATASAAAGHHLPDAEIFATNNTAVITDPGDPRLQDPLTGFARDVEGLVARGGGKPRGSELLDGVFFSSERGTTTFERSRAFDVDRVADDELHAIADSIRARFTQESVLTFDYLPPADPEADAIELEVPGVTAQALRDGLLADATAQERLFGGSVTQDGRLLLVADRADAELARAFAASVGGDLSRAHTFFGEREFVDGPAPVRVEHRTVVVTGGADDDAVALHSSRRGLAVDLGDDGSADFEIDRGRFDRVRVALGDGVDTLAYDGADSASASGDRVRLRGREPVELDDVEIVRLAGGAGADRMTVDDLSATDVFQVDLDLGAGDGERDRVTVDAGDQDDQISVGDFSGVSVLGPTFVRLQGAEATDELTVDARGGDDIVTASTGAVALTLRGGAGSDVLHGGPGDDVLLGGGDFDDVSGGKGDDFVRLGADFDRFSWAPGDGNDSVDGGASRDSLFFAATDAPEVLGVAASGRDVRVTRDVDAVELRLADLEEVDMQARGGADTVNVGDLSGTPVQLVDVSLAPGLGSAGGDGQPDRVAVTGTDADDRLAVSGRVVVAGTATVSGLPATVNVSHAEGDRDTLAIDTGAGADAVDTSGLAPGTIGLEVD